MPQPYPRRPELAEFDAILDLAGNSMYGESKANLQEWTDLRITLEDARESGRFIVSHASSDTPGYFGPIIFLIWPDTSITMYRFSSMDLPSFGVFKGEYYECDMGGMPWVSS